MNTTKQIPIIVLMMSIAGCQAATNEPDQIKTSEVIQPILLAYTSKKAGGIDLRVILSGGKITPLKFKEYRPKKKKAKTKTSQAKAPVVPSKPVLKNVYSGRRF
ncbi:hypothetical protein ACQU0X_27010 [Pseudovibrio ascidiaceicola]|uniref:hypothetical protein n=1 Tax=Pseudovibrio ascidiaceicola TaxID=285279 RepID=UPI003D35E625